MTPEFSRNQKYPAGLQFTRTHQWVRLGGGTLRVGLTDAVLEVLGRVVAVELARPGTELEPDGPLGWVETAKAAIDLQAPARGRVLAVNSPVMRDPSLLHHDPYGSGWLCELEIEPPPPSLWLDAAAYASLVAEALG